MPNNDNDNEELGIDDLQYFSIKNNQLFWHGSEIQTKSKLSLTKTQNVFVLKQIKKTHWKKKLIQLNLYVSNHIQNPSSHTAIVGVLFYGY